MWCSLAAFPGRSRGYRPSEPSVTSPEIQRLSPLHGPFLDLISSPTTVTLRIAPPLHSALVTRSPVNLNVEHFCCLPVTSMYLLLPCVAVLGLHWQVVRIHLLFEKRSLLKADLYDLIESMRDLCRNMTIWRELFCFILAHACIPAWAL